MRLLHDWILGLTAASLIAAAAALLTPEGNVRRITKLMCAVMLACVLVSPMFKTDPEFFSQTLNQQRLLTAELTGDLEDRENALLRPYIQEQCAAYIVDEARRLGFPSVRASVQVKWRDESWMPYEAAVSGELTAQQRSMLSRWLEAELGIPAERQRWDEMG